MALLLATRQRLIASIRTTTHVTSIGPAHQRTWTSGRSFLTASKPPTTPDFAFAFDIDGVLLRSSKPLPGATRSLRYLQANGIPFILLTNGGGKTEAQRVSELSRQLDVPIDVDMLLQSHTPFKGLVNELPGVPRFNDCILVLGGEGNQCRDIAEDYGFTQVVTPADLITAYPALWPWANHSLYTAHARPLPHKLGRPLRFAAILVFHDPRDWALDIQIVTDLLRSEQGVLGTLSPKNGNTELPNCGWQQDGQPEVYFSNSDLVWASEYHLDRLGQGAFRTALAAVFYGMVGDERENHKVEFIHELFGKPTPTTFHCAQQRLKAHRQSLLDSKGGGGEKEESKLKNVYMIGDNPASDILGAFNWNTLSKLEVTWEPILVKTGVYKSGKPSSPPNAIVPDVTAAVQWALKKSGWEKPFP